MIHFSYLKKCPLAIIISAASERDLVSIRRQFYVGMAVLFSVDVIDML